MKPVRRFETDIHRRDSRDRDVSRFNRKRPSMLSEFKHHGYRDSDRMSPDHVRHSRHSHDSSPGVNNEGRFTFPGPHGKLKSDPRMKRIYSPLASHHSNYRGHHHSASYNRSDSLPASVEGDEETPAKRACLSVDVTKRASEPLNSADSASSNHIGSQSPNVSTKGTGLSAYHLEDIDSDDDSLLDDPKTKPPDKAPDKPDKSDKPSKDELLLKMERVDRDISALESQIASLQKKQAELKDGGRVSPVSPVTPSPKTPSPEVSRDLVHASDRQPMSEMSLVDRIYSENQSKASTANGLLYAHTPHTRQVLPSMPLYFQPSESPFYHANIISHRKFRPKLIAHLRSVKMAAHHKDLSLCKQYDSLMTDWERRVERIESSSKKKAKDLKNRELFEKTFPELKARREQQERFTRVDQRGFGVVRSDAELNEIMYELSNKEEAPARYRRTHAIIPPMVGSDAPRFHSSNGHIEDVMAVHRDLRFTNIWTEEEKAAFRDKFLHYPKNFEMISKFIPNKNPSDCVKYYYLTKKSENFKQLIRKANLKRKKALIKPGNLSMSASLPASPQASHHPTMLQTKTEQLLTEDSRKTKSDYADWSEDNISRLKEGLRKFGRAWGKVYREVGGSKTATQCKMFYDDYCNDKGLGLQEALLEHSRAKNAEKQRRKSQSRKPPPIDTKRKTPHKASLTVAADSENTESGSDSDSSTSESTITDSGQEDTTTEPVKTTQKRPRGKKPRASISSPPLSAKTSEDVVDLFLTAAEALKNNVAPAIALHDHTYSMPPSELVNNMELQGTSGLSLIAAAAAVVSPNLSRNASSNKNSVSPVRAPRGRPPNKYRGGGPNSTVKLSPTYLSPAGGTNAHVLLSDLKSSAFRNRTRSAPTDRPKSTIHLPRSGSTLARVPLATSTPGRKQSYTKQRSDSPSLKPTAPVSQPQASSAFEALVNVAVAAPPAELPKSSTVMTKTPVNKQPSTPSTASPGNSSMSSKLTMSRTNSNDSNNSSLNNGTTATAYIDVSHAINILASLAQGSAGNTHTIVFPTNTTLSQASSLIVSQSTSSKPIPSVAPSNSVDNLLTHLKSSPRSTPSPKPASRTKKQSKNEPGKTTENSSDDLSNLKLLSSLVAAVAGTPSPLSVSTAPGDTTTHSTPSGKFPSPSIEQWDLQGKSPNSSSQWNNYNNSESDDLPRGVVRPSLSPYSSSTTTSDMTASLASIIPSYNPSVGQQSTLLLYTRSRSFPQNSDSVMEEEDHLESATRGISELSKLLGTDSHSEGELISKKGHDLASSFLNAAENIEASSNGTASLTRVVLSDITTPASPANKRSLLESPVHHANSTEGALNLNSQTR